MAETKSPVQEVGFSIQFSSPSTLTVLDVADIYSLYKDQYPVFQQVNALAPMAIPVAGEQHQIQFGILGSNIPRLWFISADQKSLVQVQHDRVSSNWRRLAPANLPADYPGYYNLRDEFFTALERIANWTRDRSLGSGDPGIAELFYQNAVPLSWGGVGRRLSEVLSFFKPQRAKPVAGFQVGWFEVLSEDYPSAITISANVGATPDGEAALLVQLSSHFDVQGCSREALQARFDFAHEKLHELLPAVFTSEVLETFR